MVNIINQTDLIVESCTLKDLLLLNSGGTLPQTGTKATICIPEYQRPYVWKEKQVKKLLLDLIDYHNDTRPDKPLYYLGSFILHHDSQKNRLNIIDGQQRLTTMLILNSFMNQQLNADLEISSPTSRKNIQLVHSYLNAILDNDEIYEFRNINVSKLVPFEYINTTLILTKSEDLAYTFFETQNTGGVRLSGSDIAKAHHLRAINGRKRVAYYAKKWESLSPTQIEDFSQTLIKIRYWNNRKWLVFPFYREEQEIKNTIIEEFTESTSHSDINVSHYFTIVKQQGGRALTIKESEYSQIRQPLYDGVQFVDFIHDYVLLYNILFVNSSDYRIPDEFYQFRNNLLHGNDGTIFLKELMEVALVAYVSRFGFECIFEITLWLYRHIYSLRVSFSRNIREDSIFKFVFDKFLMDNILESYTINELLDILKRFSYPFDENYVEDHQSKGKFVRSVKAYFDSNNLDGFTSAKEMASNNNFDKVLVKNIIALMAKYENE